MAKETAAVFRAADDPAFGLMEGVPFQAAPIPSGMRPLKTALASRAPGPPKKAAILETQEAFKMPEAFKMRGAFTMPEAFKMEGAVKTAGFFKSKGPLSRDEPFWREKPRKRPRTSHGNALPRRILAAGLQC